MEKPVTDWPLPAGVQQLRVNNGNGLTMHCLIAGTPGNPCLLLLHGFPELSFSWRHQLTALARAGYYVIAPDQRGYGQTRPATHSYNDSIEPFQFSNLTADLTALLDVLGIAEVRCVIGHDFGSPVAAWTLLSRPERFQALVMMSAPFAGPPSGEHASPRTAGQGKRLSDLTPPRQHYQRYFCTAEANSDMWQVASGVDNFLSDYFYAKSGDWPGNRPKPLASASAEMLAQIPDYYIMPADQTMPEVVARIRSEAAQPVAMPWLSEEALEVYAESFTRTSFQGGLNWYRAAADPALRAWQVGFSGRRIERPACFIAGDRDWGPYQSPGALQRMEEVCTRFSGTHLVAGAGHWVMQEAPDAVNELLQQFLAGID